MAYYDLARIYFWLQNTKAGEETLQKAQRYINRTTEKEKLYIEAGFAEFIGSDSEKRFNRLHQITEKYPQEKRAHLDLAWFYFNRKKLYTQAIERIQRVIELDPNLGLAYNMLAFTYMQMGEYDKALETLKHYASLNPGDANVFDSTGELYLRMGELDRALLKYKEATEVEPSYFYAYRTIAYVYALKEDYPQTMKWIDRYLKIAPSDGIKARGHVYRAFYYFWLGQFEQSLKELIIASKYYEAVESKSGLAYIDWVSGWIYFFKSDYTNGLKHSRHWLDMRIKHNPELTQLYQAEYNFYCGMINLRETELDTVKSILTEMKQKLHQIDPANKDRIKYYHDIMNVEFLLSQDSIEKAIFISDTLSPLQIPSIHPTSLVTYNLPFPNVRDYSVRAHQLDGDLDRAISENEKLIKINPKSKDLRLIHPVYYFRLAKLYEENGQLDNAKENYKKFLAIWNHADQQLPEVIEAKICLDKFLSLYQ
jgi:tetratricopeptide (TPR) repeat protein